MTTIGVTGHDDVAALAGMERQLAETLVRTAGEVSHIQCLDNEQRAEIYAILQALKLDTEAHHSLASMLSTYISERPADA